MAKKGYGQIGKEELGFTYTSRTTFYLYCGHRNLLALPAWQQPANESFRRMIYRIWPRVTIANGDTLTMRLIEMGYSSDEIEYAGPLTNQTVATPLGEIGTISTSPDGKLISGCDAMPAGEEQVEGTCFALAITGGADEYTVHGIVIEQVNDLGYNAGSMTTECDCVEQTAHTVEAGEYHFVDSWLGQAQCAHSIDRYAFEDRCAIYVPFFHTVPT